MMVFLRNMGFSRIESLLGLTVVTLVVAFVLPRMKVSLDAEQGQRAEIETRALAETIRDYHGDTGHWPHNHHGQADLADLAATDFSAERRPAQAGLLGSLVQDEAWLTEVPLDPWGRPYRAFVPTGETGMILVVSAGRNGTLETRRDQLADISGGGRLASGPVLSGDDIGYLISESNQTGKR